MLKLDRVSLHYGSFRALNDISLDVRDGELVVLLGANGAGKSSIFRAASGLVHATGHICFGDRELIGMRPSRIVEAGVVQCPEGRKLFPGMSVLRNLMLGAYVYRADGAGNRRRLEEIFGLFPILDQKKDDPAGSLSGGQQQMVAIGRAMMGRPRALLLDEPSLGLAPLVVRQMFEVIQQINRAGTTVLLAEQNAFAALKVAHRAYVLELGHVVMAGDSDSLLRDPAIRRAYIGA